MSLNYLFSVMQKNADKEAIIINNTIHSYQDLLNNIQNARVLLDQNEVLNNSVVALQADFSLMSIAIFLALIEKNCIIAPLSLHTNKSEFIEIAEAEYKICVQEKITISKISVKPTHHLLKKLNSIKHPGLILFSSGSTGKSKAAVHDFSPLLDKFTQPRHAKRMIAFLLFDHIGGINTLLYALYNGGTIIIANNRQPKYICELIHQHQVEILPTSPTFINLLLLSKVYQDYDLSSLELVTYGTEVMPENTLQRFHQLFPSIRLQQTYGLSEIGILRSKSESFDSLWVKIGGEGYETRVRDGLLEVKAQSAMLGYLNAENPFTEDGWFKTGDAVETKGDYFKILGRKSDIINIGGEKVYPAEVESILLQMQGVDAVAVFGEKHPLTGSIVKAKIKINTQENLSDFRQRMYLFCQDKLENFKIPQKIILTLDNLHNERFKTIRRDTIGA